MTTLHTPIEIWRSSIPPPFTLHPTPTPQKRTQLILQQILTQSKRAIPPHPFLSLTSTSITPYPPRRTKNQLTPHPRRPRSLSFHSPVSTRDLHFSSDSREFCEDRLGSSVGRDEGEGIFPDYDHETVGSDGESSEKMGMSAGAGERRMSIPPTRRGQEVLWEEYEGEEAVEGEEGEWDMDI